MKMILKVLFCIVYSLVSSASILHYAPSTALYTHAFPLRSHQYLSQDTLGQYSYGYTGTGSSKSELKLLDGITRGSYSYVDANGQLQTVKYIADDVNGFQVAGTNLPVHNVEELQPVQDTEEVRQAKENHLAALKEAEKQSAEQIDELQETILNNENKNEHEQVNELMENDDTVNQNEAHEAISVVSPKERLKPYPDNYQTSYVQVTTPENSFAYSVYDYPNSVYFVDNGYTHTYANAFSDYRQQFLLNYNTLNGKNNKYSNFLLNNNGYELKSVDL